MNDSIRIERKVYFGCGLTEKTRQPLRLFVMYDGYTESVEGHQTQNNPVEGVSLHHTANGDP